MSTLLTDSPQDLNVMKRSLRVWKKDFGECMTEKGVTVSVIIPTFNSSGTLNLTLQTVLYQEFTDFEVWVIGDGCTDDSEHVVASFADERLHWVNLPSNSGGPSVPRNEGLRRAGGRYVAYIGHDDLWFPWHLSELVDCIENGKSDFVYSLGTVMAPEGVIGTFSLAHEPWSRTEFISPSNWLHRKSLTEVVGYWSTAKRLGDDQEFLRRLLNANVRLGFRRQLSVLKFPAAMWRMYSIKSDFPQERYVESLRHDPAGLRNEILLEFAAFGSVTHKEKSSLHTRLRRGVNRLLQSYGEHRWPLNRMLYQRYRRRAGLDTRS